ncbi:MAG: 3,4-dihydroxy-2-butanone-4-phosphate synthase [Gammaproteobacteria bacterium]|nr:3,4-dihydroxy-2-butanone-4-phosphate synthase [Gammaproteobacteria bacterium]MBV9621989.1 3,4-dihydroxy-2-butanone-4-phosphate synthase [Gammaproteobacteria bacterium]
MSRVLPLTGKAAEAGSRSSVEEILRELQAGRMVIIMDDEDRENEGDLIMAAQYATPEAVAFMIRHTSGIICVPMEEEPLARLELPQMVPINSESHRTAFTVSVDLRAGTTTGVSSADRAATIRALADPGACAADFARPGHIFPLRARRGGVLVRAGHTEAAVDLCRLAGLQSAGVLCEVMNEDGSMARRPQLQEFARRHQLRIGTIADLIRHRLRTERSVERLSEHSVQTELGEFRLYVYQDRDSLDVHIALAHGRLDAGPAPLVRVHLADTLRDLFGVRSHPRTWTLRAAMQRIIEAGSGVVIVLRQQETARELIEAVRSFATAAAVSEAAGPGEGSVLRTFGIGAQILKDLGVTRMRVLSAPKQMHGISAFGLEIEGYVGDAG